MDEKVKDFIIELGGFMRDRDKPKYDQLFVKWGNCFRRLQINAADEQLDELLGILRARVLSGIISLVPPDLDRMNTQETAFHLLRKDTL